MFGTHAHYCEYTELLFCTDCFGSATRPIPWRVVHELDPKPRYVMQRCNRLFRGRFHNYVEDRFCVLVMMVLACMDRGIWAPSGAAQGYPSSQEVSEHVAHCV